MTLNRASFGTRVTAVVSAALLIQSSVVSAALLQTQTPPAATTTPPATAPKLPADQLDSLVAPIALYPDPLLAQVLAASTYPLEIVQLQQWMAKNSELKGEALRKTHGLTIDGLGLVEVLVSSEDEERARALLASAEQGSFRLEDDAPV